MQYIAKTIDIDFGSCYLDGSLQNQIFNKFQITDLNEGEWEQISTIDDAILSHELSVLLGDAGFVDDVQILSRPNVDQKDFGSVKNEFETKYRRLTGQQNSGLSVGIDGCKGKWIAVAIFEGGFDVGKYGTIEEICDKYEHADSMIIDIPIGLAESKDDVRPDRIVKKYLGKKGSSIFDTPCRQAIYAMDKESARDANINILGKSLSEQSLAIGKAILQVDLFLQERSIWKNRLLESHPEYCFMVLNDDMPVLSKKIEKDGQKDRMDILSRYYSEAQEVLDKFLGDVPYRTKVDDVIDAMCLAVIGCLMHNKSVTLCNQKL